MADFEPLNEPMSHAIDADVLHFPFGVEIPLHDWTGKIVGTLFGWLGIHGLTKFMFLELVAFAVLLAVLVPLAVNLRKYGYPKGLLANAIEATCVFIRDTAAVPALGEKDAPKFLPYLWSVFFFILVCNLLGLLPWLGSPTGALGCTTALALCSLALIHGSGIVYNGLFGYVKSIVPRVPLPIYILMIPIELIGHVIKPSVLAFRLFVNMTAGHTLLFVFLCFIGLAGDSLAYWIVTPSSFLAVVAFSFLELLVAFVQAYVFTFLSAIFIGAAAHPSH
jgi:F-type H+-transporting ATPase subunit a